MEIVAGRTKAIVTPESRRANIAVSSASVTESIEAQGARTATVM